MWVNEINNQEYSTEEEAYDAAIEMVDLEDLSNVIGFDVSIYDIIQELRRLDSPLYYELLDLAIADVFKDYFHKIDDDDEEYEENP